jgi:hypothetical protein
MPRPDLPVRLNPFAAPRQRGISVVEIALMLLILALTLGVVFKGQEMIFGARSKAMISQTEQVKVAYLGFQDRFRALPGDYREAPTVIPGVVYHGDGSGRIDLFGTATGPNGVAEEDMLVWDHLSKAGFYPGSFPYQTSNPQGAIPKNIFGGYVALAFDLDYGNPAAPQPPKRHLVKTGNQVPVQFLAEMDLKIDDGNALRGGFQFSTHAYWGANPVGPPSAAGCADTAGNWRTAAATPPTNCGAASLM